MDPTSITQSHVPNMIETDHLHNLKKQEITIYHDHIFPAIYLTMSSIPGKKDLERCFHVDEIPNPPAVKTSFNDDI